MKKQLSIIIPVYNAENTIKRTLNSIYNCLSLTEDNFEVIIIDDCSTDSTIDIIQSYQKGHPNITIIRQHRNMRQGAARNRGIDEAEGEWITFVDADDCLEQGINKALTDAIQKKCDIVAFDYTIQHINGQIETMHLFERCIDICSGKQFMNNYIDNRINARGTPWGYIFNSIFLKNQRQKFIENRIYEDADVIFQWIINCNKFYLTHSIGYSYILTSGSSTLAVKNSKTLADAVHLEYRKLLLAEQNKDELPYFYEIMHRIAMYYMIGNMNILLKSHNIEIVQFKDYLGTNALDYIISCDEIPFRIKCALNHPCIAPLLGLLWRIYAKVIKLIKKL